MFSGLWRAFRNNKFNGFLLQSAFLFLLCATCLNAEVIRWIKTYNGPGGGSDSTNAIVYGADGNLYAAGYSTGSGTSGDFFVISYTTAGDTNWTYRYNGPGNASDEAKAIVYGADGNIYVAGYSRGIGTSRDFTVISLTTTGSQNWVYRYNGPGNSNDQANAIVYGADGNIYAAGYSTGSGTNRDFTVISLTTGGGQNWIYQYNGPSSQADAANAIVYGADNNIYAAGYSTGSGYNYDFAVISLTTGGSQNWVYRYNGPRNSADEARAIVYGIDGNIYAAGYSTGLSWTYDFTVISLTTGGVANWINSYNGSGNNNDEANAIVYGGDGNVYAAGYTRGYGTNRDFTVISYKTTSTRAPGDTNWIYRYNGPPGNAADQANAIVYGADGNIYAAGYSTGSGTNRDLTTISLTTTGTANWVDRYNGTGNNADEVFAIVYGSDGNIYIAGYATGVGTSSDLIGLSLTQPSVAVIPSFDVYVVAGKTVIEWQTCSEINTIGFNLLRYDEARGEYFQVNAKLLPSLLHFAQGGTYRYVDETAFINGIYTYKLVEVDADGNQTMYGPFTKRAEWQDKNITVESGYSRTPHQPSKSVIKANSTVNRRSKSLECRLTTNQVKMTVTEDGLYYLSAQQIAQAFNMSVAQVINMIQANNWQLSNQGQQIAWLAANGNLGIYFYGQKVSSVYTDANVYWLKQGRGTNMGTINGPGPAPTSVQQTFCQTLHFEENQYALTALFNDPQSDYWLWDYIIAGDPGLGTKNFTFNVSGRATTSNTATLTLNLQGGTNTEANPDHHVTVSLNGTQIGESYWDSLASQTVAISFNQSLLYEGENALTVTGLLEGGVAYSIFYVNFFDVAYQRLYRADSNELYCPSNGSSVITISGFTNSNIMLFEINTPALPKKINAVTIDNIGGDYRISFRPTSRRCYLALTSDAVNSPISVIADVPSNLKSPNNNADYIIITPAEFKETIQQLAQYRQNLGYRTMTVDIEDIMDEFNYGIYNPEAVRDFLSYIYHNAAWDMRRYVLLVGAGTYDYKNNQGYGGNLIPVLMYGTPYGLFASDNSFVDIDGNDGVPEMAIGRLPANTQGELQVVIDKIIAYEGAGGSWVYNVLMLADNPDGGGNFTLDSDSIAALVPPYYATEKIYLADHSIEEARQMVLDGIDSGALFMNFFGHGGLDRLCEEGLLTTDDIDALTNGERLPVMTAMTCVVSRFEIPGYRCLSANLVLKDAGGMIATWAPTSLCINSLSRILDAGFYKAAFDGSEQTLGDMILRGLKEYAQTTNEPYVLYVYTLLGDPALELR